MNAVKVIAVSSGKGGVGKTNVSVNLACQLARRGNRVLLMDADLGLANVDIMLGLKPKWNLSHVLDGKCSIEDILLPGPDGISIIPAASGIKKMAELGNDQHAAIVRSLSALSGDYDVMIVDTAAGISDSVITFSRASQYVLVVVTDELTSMADAYALIKVMNRDAGIKRFKVLRNMVNSYDQARDGFERLNEVAQRFLDVTLEYAGFIPRDPYLIKADTRQKAVSDLYPGAESSLAFRRLAETVDKWPMPTGPSGNIEFFVDRMFSKEENRRSRDVNGHSAYLNVQYGSREELVTRHAPLVKRIAYHLVSRLPASVEVDDLIQAGMIGLLEAGSNYQMDKGASFETFASIRIRGAMIDQMRHSGWAPRSVTRQLREMSEAVRKVESRLGREASGNEIAEEMSISLDEYHELLRDTSSVRLFSLDQMSEGEHDTIEVGGGDDRYAPLENVLEDDFQSALASQINALPEREKLVMALYYENGLNLKEIGEVMEVSESRVCQIHSQAIVRLKGRLSEWTAA